MPFPPDSRVVALLDVFDDPSNTPSFRYSPTSSGQSRRYVHRARDGDLDVTVWTHSGTAWVCLRGLLGRRAARALTSVLVRADATHIVLNTAELTLPSSRGGTPLVALCATLSGAGYTVTVVGPEDDGMPAQAALDRARPGLLWAAGA